jgi:hypothetical protein
LRELVPIEQCEAVISCVPESCRRYGGLVRPEETTTYARSWMWKESSRRITTQRVRVFDWRDGG